MARYRVGLETRDRILAATRDLLAEGGLEGATLNAICKRAGIQPGSFYNLFGSKEEVVLTVVRQAITAVDPDPSGTGSDTVFDLVAAYVRFITEEEPLARVYLRMAVGGALTDRAMAGRVLRHHQARVARFAEAMDRASPGADNSLRAEALVAALNGYALQSLLDPSFDFAKHAERLVAEGTMPADWGSHP
jgi:AcrR family transcriptional regulator